MQNFVRSRIAGFPGFSNEGQISSSRSPRHDVPFKTPLKPLSGANNRKRVLVTITDEEWDISELRASTSLNKSVSDEADVAGGRVSRRGRSAGYYKFISIMVGFRLYSEKKVISWNSDNPTKYSS